MIATPRERATAALTVIDRHHDAYGHGGPYNMPGLNQAYAALAAAMNAIYGPLPDEMAAWHMRRLDREEEL